MRTVQRKLNSAGFTLAELLIVISIIALLSSIVLVTVRETRQDARDAKRIADMRTLFTTMTTCQRDVECGGRGQYVTYADYESAQAGGIGALLRPGNLPEDPLNNEPYVYQWVDNTEEADTYCIYADLEGGGMYFISDGGIESDAADGSDASACP